MNILPWSDVVSVQHLGDHRLRVEFADGLAGTIDLASVLSFRGVFAALKDPAQFAQARVDPEVGTLVWPNGADIAPETIYELVKRAKQSEAPLS